MDNRCGFWFGTIGSMGWIRTPNSGADMSPSGWGEDGTFLNGGAYVRQSWGSHREYTFEWPESSNREMSSLMQAYRNGTYGRGLIYFIDPTMYDQNILPARWADPSMAIADEGAPMVYGVYPEGVVTSGGDANMLPVRSAYYNLDATTAGYRTDSDTLFIPIPEGYTLYIGAMFVSTGTGGMYVTPVDESGGTGANVALTQVPTDATNIVPDTFSGGAGVRLWTGKNSAGDASVTIAAITARLYRTGATPPTSFTSGPWMTGSGNSGCRFVGNPTDVAISGINGGQRAFAATFAETGDWS